MTLFLSSTTFSFIRAENSSPEILREQPDILNPRDQEKYLLPIDTMVFMGEQVAVKKPGLIIVFAMSGPIMFSLSMWGRSRGRLTGYETRGRDREKKYSGEIFSEMHLRNAMIIRIKKKE